MKNEDFKKAPGEGFFKIAVQDTVNTSCCGSDYSSCGCSVDCCSDESGTDTDTIVAHGDVSIDGQVISITSTDKNIVELASRAKIGIPAPCYRDKQNKGCCSACVVEINGEQKFACSTVPENGMNIVVDRADLKAIRKQRLLEYKEGIKSGNPCSCSSPDSGDCCK